WVAIFHNYHCGKAWPYKIHKDILSLPFPIGFITISQDSSKTLPRNQKNRSTLAAKQWIALVKRTSAKKQHDNSIQV
ncbi:MAG: hypothetical protein AAB508_04485, partial [Patescibacteria group bacterium]